MDFATFRPVYVLFTLLFVGNGCAAFAFSSNACPKLDIAELLIHQENQCIFDGAGNLLYGSAFALQVAEVNGTILERVLSILQSKQDANAAILYYAEWCPFSRSVRSLFDTLSPKFPGIYHIAVEESAIQPSALSQTGVHSFPVLFLHSKAVKVRYRGPRTFDAISEFYRDVTGFKTTHHKSVHNGIAFIEKLSKESMVQAKVKCPLPWAKSPEKWLCDDMYLLLSSVFLVLRVLSSFIPRFLVGIKYYWGQKEKTLDVHRLLLRKMLLREQVSDTRGPGKGCFESESSWKGKKALSVPGWSSSHLAAVTLAETSSRSGSVEDGQEKAHGFGSHFWG